MYEYKHGGNAIFEHNNNQILDLSANINPLGFPEGVAKAVSSEIPNCIFYPDNESHKLAEAISLYERIAVNKIFCANGASDIIFRLPLALKPSRVLILAPTFSDYERSVLSYGAEITYYYLRENTGFHVSEDIAKEVQIKKIDMIFICNPNNPTGVLTERNIVEHLLRICIQTNTYVVVDECFMDFTELAGEYTSKPLLNRYGNLIILKAFTKVFALPGIRLGYALCGDKGLVDKLKYHGMDWPVSNLAQSAGIEALSGSKEYLKRTVDFVTRERSFIKSELEKMGFITYESSANYVFFKSLYKFDLWEALNKHGIRIRPCNNFIGLTPEYYRVGVSQPENNLRFINTLKEVIECQNL